MRFETNVEEIKQLPKPVKIRNGSREATRIAKRGSVVAALLRGRTWTVIKGEPRWQQSTSLANHQSDVIVNLVWCLVDLGLLSGWAARRHEQDATAAREKRERDGDLTYARTLVKDHGYKVVKKPKRKKGGAS